MIRQLWAKFGRRKERTGHYLDENNPEQGVVPLRNRKPRDPVAGPEASIVTKKDHAERFTESVHQLVNKLEGIHDHLGRQVDQNEQLLAKMGQLPELLKTMPEAISRQEQAVYSLLNQLQEKSRQDQEVLSLLSSLPDQSARQSRTLGEIHQQLAQSLREETQLNEQVSRVSDVLKKLDKNTVSQTEWLEHMSRTFMVTDRYLKLTLAKQQRRFLWILIVCMGICLLSVLGLILGIYLLQSG